MPIIQIISLYLLIALGFYFGRKKLVKTQTLANILYYFLAPGLVFRSLINTSFNSEELKLGVIYFILSVVIFYIFKLFCGSQIHGFMAGSTNSGYFGIPFTVSLLGSEYTNLAIACAVAYLLYEGLIGYKKTKFVDYLKIPLLISLVTGLIISFGGFRSWVYDFGLYKSLEYLIYPSFTLLGMLLIGSALAQAKTLWPVKFTELKYLFWRQAIWLVFLGGALLITKSGYNLLSQDSLDVLTIMALTPIAGNSVLVAQQNNDKVEQIAKIVFYSSVISAIILSSYLNLPTPL